jgi:hypothetical protein
MNSEQELERAVEIAQGEAQTAYNAMTIRLKAVWELDSKNQCRTPGLSSIVSDFKNKFKNYKALRKQLLKMKGVLCE